MDATKGHVLLVEDEQAVRRAYARILSNAGFFVIEAQDAANAVTLLSSMPFDAVLSDVRMPGMSGLDMVRVVRERDLDLPILLMTGNPEVSLLTRAIDYGVLRFLVKPVTSEDLVENVSFAVRVAAIGRTRRQALGMIGDVNKFVGDRAGIEVQFNRALEGLWMAYQPIVWAKTNQIFAYEALVRTREKSLASPPMLFDAAERLDRVNDLSRAIRAFVAQTIKASDTTANFFVNMHATDMLDDELFDAGSPLTPLASRVVLEITERAAFDDLKDAQRRTDALRSLGFRVAIDDLGAGYAGLSWFAQLLPEIVKIDMSLVRGIDGDVLRQRVVESVVALSNDAGLFVVAEGVETAAERDRLVELGCDLLQGYFFAKPQAELVPDSALPAAWGA